MIENKSATNKSFASSLHDKMCRLFLHTVFNNPNFIKGELSKHLEIPNNEIILSEEKNIENENGEVVYSLFSLSMFGSKFSLRFDRRIEKPKDIEVPKIVKKPKKWYQIGDPETMVVLEKKQSNSKPLTYWVLNSIE